MTRFSRFIRYTHHVCQGLVCSLALLAGMAEAQLSIEVTGGGNNRIPVAIADFGGDSSNARALSAIIRADLERSGLFRVIDPGLMAMTENTAVDYGTMQGKGANALAAGSLNTQGDGRLEARFRLYDVQKRTAIGGSAYITNQAQLRAAGHRIADYIYEKLMGGERGIFGTRIAYVLKQDGRYILQIADSDGQNARSALVSKEPIISPVWSPDGMRVAYVSFESKKPVVYVHSLQTGQRQPVANFKGSNSAPAWSPDGSKLAIVLTKDGNSQLYGINADGSGIMRLSTSPGIDTEPAWSSDGNIYFTSDRGGSPQIYRIPASGGSAQRITFDGAYNVTPRPSPDGKNLAFIMRREGRFQLAVMDLASRQVQVVSDSHRDESPTFAPNGRMILIATHVGGRNILSAVSIDGTVKQKISVLSGDIREPAWGPFPK